MADSSPRTLRWVTWLAAASALCIFLGLPSAAFVGPMTRAPTVRIVRSATESAVQEEEDEDKDLLPGGQEVTLLAPAALAGTKAFVVSPIRDGSGYDSYEVRLPSGSIFNIPVDNMEIIQASKSSSQASSLKASNLWSQLKLSCGAVKRRWTQLFKKPGAGAQRTKKPDFQKAPASPAPEITPAPASAAEAATSQTEASEEEQDEFFVEGQQVILLYPPPLAGKPGTVVGATQGGDYSVQLPSGSVFHIAKGSMKPATESGLGGDSGDAGRSGGGYGGGNGLPPGRAGSTSGEDEPERSNTGTSALLVKLAVLVMLLGAVFYRPVRRMLQELLQKHQVPAILRRIDRRPVRSAGSGLGVLAAILCLALYLVFPQLLSWFRQHVVPLISKAGAAGLSVQHHTDGSGSSMDKLIAMWPLAVLVLASLLFTEKSKLPWRTGESDDEAKTSPNQHSLKFDGLSLKDVNQDLFKSELRQRLHENGVSRSKTEKLNIELRSGSVIAVMRGPADILRSVKALGSHKLRVMGIAPKVYKDHGNREVRFEEPEQESEEDDAASERQSSHMVRRNSISRLPPASESQEASSVAVELEEFKAEIQKHDNKGFPQGSRSRRRPIPFLSPVAEEDSGPVIGFEVEFKSAFGDRLMVVGDHRGHGEWDPEETEVELFTDTAHYPAWSGFWKPKERSGLTHQYKLVVLKANGDYVWETIENRKVCLSSNERWLVKLKFNEPTV